MKLSVRLNVSETPTDEEKEVFDALREFNVAHSGESNHQLLYLFARNDAGQVIGGLRGVTHWGWLYVMMLVVQEPYRRVGVGKKLLLEAEAEALRRGCRHSYLDTFTFQARGFYERLGYTLFGTLDDFPPGHQRFFLQKRLLIE